MAAAGGTCVLCGGAHEVAFEKQGFLFARCVACGLLSLDPLPTVAALDAHHQASYETGRYAAFAAAEDVRATIADYRLARVRRVLPAGRWLDVGCSTGAFLAAATVAGMTVEGIELSASAAAAARARGFAVREGRVEDVQPAGPFAAVTAFDVVEHLLDPVGFVRRVAGWLADDGALAVTVPDAASPTARLLGRAWFYYAPPDHVHYFTSATLRRLLESAGFRDVRVEPIGKPITLAYATAQVAAFYPALEPLVRPLGALVPAALARRPIPLPLGEILATGRRPAR